MKYIYIAGRYTGHTHDYRSYFEIHRHITDALEAARQLAYLGYGFFCPHAHSAHFEVIAPEVKPTYWYELDNKFLAACDAILMLPDWEKSKGAVAERELAISLGMPVFYDLQEMVEKFPPEG